MKYSLQIEMESPNSHNLLSLACTYMHCNNLVTIIVFIISANLAHKIIVTNKHGLIYLNEEPFKFYYLSFQELSYKKVFS